MVDLIIFILATSGLTWIITKSPLFKPLREKITRKHDLYFVSSKAKETKNFKNSFKLNVYKFLDAVLSCEGCFGFYAAISIYVVLKYHPAFVYPFIGSIGSLFIISLIRLLNRK